MTANSSGPAKPGITRHWGRALDWILNTLCVGMAVLVLGILVKDHSARSRTTGKPQAAIYSPLLQTDWAANRTTLVMALSVGCHWCRESAGFYQRLLASNSTKKYHAIAVFPQPVAESQAYLSSLGIAIADVRQADLNGIGIEATPTLILADASGRIQSTWIGKLSSSQEAEVFRKLGAEGQNLDVTKTAEAMALVTAPQIRHLLDTEPVVPIVDIRPRSSYRRGHILGSVNIPQDELGVRATHEIPGNSMIVLYCHYCPPCQSAAQERGIATYCGVGALFLHQLGFSRVHVLKDDLEQLKAAGVGVVGVSQEFPPASPGQIPKTSF